MILKGQKRVQRKIKDKLKRTRRETKGKPNKTSQRWKPRVRAMSILLSCRPRPACPAWPGEAVASKPTPRETRESADLCLVKQGSAHGAPKVPTKKHRQIQLRHSHVLKTHSMRFWLMHVSCFAAAWLQTDPPTSREGRQMCPCKRPGLFFRGKKTDGPQPARRNSFSG